MKVEQGIALGVSVLAIAGGAVSLKHGTDLEKAYNKQCLPASPYGLVSDDPRCSAENDNIEGWKLGGVLEELGGIGLIGVVLIVSGNRSEERLKTQREPESPPSAQS